MVRAAHRDGCSGAEATVGVVMSVESHHKISATHLARQAYLYVRQSTLRQVLENTESTKRQYALRERAVALGWKPEQVVVIDSDLGQSGADADRAGFQRLVAAVGMGEVGMVLGLEVSRLARNSSDWHRLLEICALADTLILDEDGLYDPQPLQRPAAVGHEGHDVRGRAARAEGPAHRRPAGQSTPGRAGDCLCPWASSMTPWARWCSIPTSRSKTRCQQFFETFRRTGSATATVRSFRESASLLFPRRVQSGPHKGEVFWGELLALSRHSTC